MSIQSAKTLVAAAENYLRVTPSGDRHISQDTAKALVELLIKLQNKHPDISKQTNFSPYAFNDRTLSFVTAVAIREAEHGKNPSNDLRVAYNMVKYINRGELTDGTTFAIPAINAPWIKENQNANQFGRFFNPQVYQELGIWSVNRAYHHMGATKFVSHKALFAPDNADPAQQKLIEEIAKDLKIQPVDPKAKEWSYSQDSVARIATEILARQATGICNLKNESDITRAIMSGQYMPHIVDMRLAEMGFGRHNTWENGAQLEELRRIDIIPYNQNPPERRFDLYRHGEVNLYQSGEWAKRFGKLDSSYTTEIMRHNGETQIENHLSPFSYLDPLMAARHQAYRNYIDQRENIYLPRLNWLAFNGHPLCRIEQTAAPNHTPAPQSPRTDTEKKPVSRSIPCTANSAFSCGRGNEIMDNAISATGQKEAATPPCTANSLSCTKPKPTTPVAN